MLTKLKTWRLDAAKENTSDLEDGWKEIAVIKPGE